MTKSFIILKKVLKNEPYPITEICFFFLCRMRYVAAYLLLALGGKPNASAADVKKVLQSVGVEIDDEKLGIVIKELEGKKVKDLIEEGE